MTNGLGISLMETILKSDLPALINELGEIGIDTLIDDGVFKDVPIFGAITAISKTCGNIRDYYLSKKLLKFLKEISSLSAEERKMLIEKLDTDQKYASHIGERIIDLLSRLDDENKPSLIAKAFKLYAKGGLSYIQLQRINHAIERFLLCDLDELKSFCDDNADFRKTDANPVTANFINAGLGYAASGAGAGGVHPTETAKLLIFVANTK